MKRKLIVGGAIVAIALTTGVTVYAAVGEQGYELEDTMFQSEISINEEGSLSFENIDKTNLPDGVEYREEISMNEEGSLSFENMDKTNLPENVEYQEEISINGEGSLSFENIDKTNLPDGVQYIDDVSMGDGKSLYSLQ